MIGSETSHPQQLSCRVIQFPVSLSIPANLKTILAVLETAQPWELLLFPEGALSGYASDPSFLEQVNLDELNASLDVLQAEAAQRRVSLWVGAVNQLAGRWYNQAYGFTPHGQRQVYRKINLANHERGVFTAGDDLPLFELFTPGGPVPIGIQICRELRFPEQWLWLARQGAQIFLHPNNAVGTRRFQSVWRSHLVARAAETQRFVLSANAAHLEQISPTLVVGPDGLVLAEVLADHLAVLQVELDLQLVSNLYQEQSRQDVVGIAWKR